MAGTSGILSGIGQGALGAGVASGNPLLIGGGAALSTLGSYFGMSDAERAARQAYQARMAALGNAENLLQSGYDQSQSALSPLYDAYGGSAQTYADAVNSGKYDQAYGKTFSDYWNPNTSVQDYLDPSMNYQRQQMTRSVDESAAAAGLLGSGGTLKELQDRATQLAQTDYGNAYNRMSNDRSQKFNEYTTALNDFNTRMANSANRAAGLASAETGLLQNKSSALNTLYGQKADIAAQRGGAQVSLISDQNNAWTGYGNQVANTLGGAVSGLYSSGALNGLGSSGLFGTGSSGSGYSLSDNIPGYTQSLIGIPSASSSGLFDQYYQYPTSNDYWGFGNA